MANLDKLWDTPQHVVAICGGAVSGSEAASACAERGMIAIVFEQNARPYGKIEDGLPRWHDKLREQEYARIDENLSHDNVLFVPNTMIGRDFSLAELANDSALSAVLLANGAWRDRPLPVPGAHAYVGRGLVYQNAFVHAFNHFEEADYTGPRFEVHDDAIVVGGGLASVDVVKIINLVLYRDALRTRGIEVPFVELEHLGIPKTLAEHGIAVSELGIKGATLYYRRRVRDMPVAFPKDDSAEQLAKTEAVREKLVAVLAQKFCVRIAECHAPVAPVVQDDRLVGLRFVRSELRDGKLVEIAGSDYDVRSPLIVSSIGSVPEPMPGVPQKGELYDYASWETGEVAGLPGVFGLGNVLTGKGNIKDSRQNAREIAAHVASAYLGLSEPPLTAAMDAAHATARLAAQQASLQISKRPRLPADQVRAVLERVQARWNAVSYAGEYRAWIAAHQPR